MLLTVSSIRIQGFGPGVKRREGEGSAGAGSRSLPGSEADPLEVVIRRERLAAPRAAMEGLPSRDRKILILRFVHDLPESAIGRLLGMPRGTVAKGIHDLLAKLRERLSRDRR